MFRLKLVVSACVMCLPALAFAQGSAGISGRVADATGGVLPGVTVEASSPALIEKMRVATTDGAGEYKIVSLPAGIYTVTFALTGFSGIRREGIELTTGFTATIDAELRVGAVEETITVSGDAPIVDVQNVKRQVVMTRDIVDALPTGKTAVEMATLIPGVQLMNGTGCRRRGDRHGRVAGDGSVRHARGARQPPGRHAARGQRRQHQHLRPAPGQHLRQLPGRQRPGVLVRDLGPFRGERNRRRAGERSFRRTAATASAVSSSPTTPTTTSSPAT